MQAAGPEEDAETGRESRRRQRRKEDISTDWHSEKNEEDGVGRAVREEHGLVEAMEKEPEQRE